MTGIAVGAKKLAVRNNPITIVIKCSSMPRSYEGPTRNRKKPMHRLLKIRMNRFETRFGTCVIKIVPKM